MLTAQQERAILALLETSDRKAVAERAGCHEQTLYKWLRDPGFRKELNDARRRFRERQIDLLAQRRLATATA